MPISFFRRVSHFCWVWHRNRKSQKSLRFRCAKFPSHWPVFPHEMKGLRKRSFRAQGKCAPFPLRGNSAPGHSLKTPSALINSYFACSPVEFCEYIFRVCLGILHWKMAGIFGESFWPPSPTKRSAKNPQKIRGKFGAKFGAKFGPKIRKIREFSFCNFPDLINRERPKRDDDNWEPHLVDHQMLHLKLLFHFTMQKRDNTNGI